MVVEADRRLAADPETDPDVLERLAVSTWYATPEDMLAQLAEDEDWLMRANVARHPNTPRQLLEKLAADPNPQVRRAARTRLQP